MRLTALLTVLLAASPIRGRLANLAEGQGPTEVVLECGRDRFRTFTDDAGSFEFGAHKGPCAVSVNDWVGHPPRLGRCARENVHPETFTVITLPRMALRDAAGNCLAPTRDGGYERVTQTNCPRKPGCAK